jgi:predicted Zn-dependent peptidase
MKNFAAAPAATKPRILLIDRPQSPQSVILAGSVLPVRGTDDTLTLQAANEVLGGDFLARINADLREKKGWSYGSYSRVNMLEHQIPFIVQAPVQADQTGPSIAAILGHLRDFNGSKGVTSTELQRVVLANTRKLPGQFETSGSILSALRSLSLYKRPDDYYETLADRYRALSPNVLSEAGRRYIDPGRMVWVVVGDAAKVRPQLEKLGLPIEVAKAE